MTRSNLGLPNREVVHSVEARHKLAAVIRVHRPNWMFCLIQWMLIPIMSPSRELGRTRGLTPS